MRALVFILLSVVLSGCCAPEARFLRADTIIWQAPERAEDLWIDVGEGGTVHGWMFRPVHAEPGVPAATLLLLHGRGDSISDYDEAAPEIADLLGMNVALVDYRGWGKSSDIECPSRRSLLDDARATLAYLREREDVDASRIALWGVSLGGLPATQLFADEPGVLALVLWASPSDSRVLINDFRGRLGFFGWAWARLSIQRWREPVREITRAGPRPVLIVHGVADGVVPVSHSVALHNAAIGAGVDSELFLDGGGHYEVQEAAMRRIEAFLRQSLAQ